MPVTPQVAAILEARAGAPSFTDMTVVQAREMMAAMPRPEPLPIHEVVELTVPGGEGERAARLYRPSAKTPLPVVVYFHGGGFAVGSLDSHDQTCRRLADAAGCAVLAVDYRLAPEHKFPAGAEDAYAATQWVAQEGASLGLDTGRVAVAGDSAGGNLATVVTLMARDRGGPSLAFQLLIYPNVDYNFERRSVIENGSDYVVSVDDMHWFWGHYFNDPAEQDNPYAVPYKAESHAGLPPALIQSAEFDFLRDEDEAYAQRLSEAGVQVTYTRYAGMVHGFFGMAGVVDEADDALAEAADALRRAFGTRLVEKHDADNGSAS